jgi:hypothetical protein
MDGKEESELSDCSVYRVHGRRRAAWEVDADNGDFGSGIFVVAGMFDRDVVFPSIATILPGRTRARKMPSLRGALTKERARERMANNPLEVDRGPADHGSQMG